MAKTLDAMQVLKRWVRAEKRGESPDIQELVDLIKSERQGQVPNREGQYHVVMKFDPESEPEPDFSKAVIVSLENDHVHYRKQNGEPAIEPATDVECWLHRRPMHANAFLRDIWLMEREGIDIEPDPEASARGVK